MGLHIGLGGFHGRADVLSEWHLTPGTHLAVACALAAWLLADMKAAAVNAPRRVMSIYAKEYCRLAYRRNWAQITGTFGKKDSREEELLFAKSILGKA